MSGFQNPSGELGAVALLQCPLQAEVIDIGIHVDGAQHFERAARQRLLAFHAHGLVVYPARIDVVHAVPGELRVTATPLVKPAFFVGVARLGHGTVLQRVVEVVANRARAKARLAADE